MGYEKVSEANRRRTKHGATIGARDGNFDPMYRIWLSVRQRCYNQSHPHYHRYGGRGIVMCDAWRDSFAQFRDDLGVRPQGASLERIDNDKGYEPNNVRWASRKEQANNRSSNVVLTHNGLTMNLKQWAAHLGWKYGLIASRWKKGLRGEELFAPRKRRERNNEDLL